MVGLKMSNTRKRHEVQGNTCKFYILLPSPDGTKCLYSWLRVKLMFELHILHKHVR